MLVLATERLLLRQLTAGDAAFILTLLNDPDWLRFIGDRGVRTHEQAVTYIEAGPLRMYAEYGIGLYLVERKADNAPLGLCGLIKRDFLDDVDLGFAFLPQYRGAGYAFEAAAGTLRYAATTLGLRRVVAITTIENERSARLLTKLGLQFERLVAYPGEQEPLRLFGRSLEPVEPSRPA